ncbi:flagellar type III secretion system protein FlhB [Sulfitobacter aestuariivivens]|uniref:Flagellar biosynthesis protein FlhB n=1 Tax=Sulfitobacter aestuariivivens TaxID=2766981 RepID=A0A927HF61_9RHOB|nr:flagellar type III secretion system protein FlhB [Sulfitobacter aestuariivivens]MBD3665512.1 flagellar biosynthesis protein FlhB [Sulfitobacter aestuariivivens]
MSAQEDDSEKSFEATPQKLLEARKKGEVAKSNDLLTAAAYSGLLVALLMAGAEMIRHLGTALMVLLDQPAALAPLFLAGGVSPTMGALLFQSAMAVLPVFAFPAAAVLLAVFAQRAMVFAPTKLAPKLSRISPIANAKNKFGRDGLFEFAKSFAKLLIYSVCLAAFINARLPEILASLQTSPQLALTLMAHLCLVFLLIVVVISLCIGGIDAVWQHHSHLRNNRMSRKEITDETKNAEGDPHLKQERRQRAMALSQNQMLSDVPDADVIVVNPSHYAVALKWDQLPGSAPVCIAKGVDEMARAIREKGAAAGVPVHRDPPTARALFATTEIGSQVAPDHYHAVAAAIRFAQAMRQRAKGLA